MDNGAWDKILDDEDELTWVVFKAAKTGLSVAGQGNGGLDEVLPLLDDNEVMFGGFRVTALDTKGGVTSTRAKLVSFSWLGPKCKLKKKMLARNLRSQAVSYFRGAHLEKNLLDGDTMTEEGLTKELLAICGAHRPERFVFGHYAQKKGAKTIRRKKKKSGGASQDEAKTPTPDPTPAAAAPAPAAAAAVVATADDAATADDDTPAAADDADAADEGGDDADEGGDDTPAADEGGDDADEGGDDTPAAADDADAADEGGDDTPAADEDADAADEGGDDADADDADADAADEGGDDADAAAADDAADDADAAADDDDTAAAE